MSGKWIWAADAKNTENERVCFVDSFFAPAEVESCEIRITAVTKYTLYLNGTYIGGGPVRSEKVKCYYDTYDLLPLMRSGKNYLAVQVWNYGWSTYQSLADNGGLYYEVIADEKELTASDLHVAARRDSGHITYAPKRNVNLGFTDYFDGRCFSQEWIISPELAKSWPKAVEREEKRILVARPIRNFHVRRQYPQQIVSVEDVSIRGQVMTVNTRHAFFGDRRDADETIMNGLIGCELIAPQTMEGVISFPNRMWNGMIGTCRIGETVYPVTDKQRELHVLLPEGRSLFLIQLNGKYDDLYCHIEFRFPKKISFNNLGTDSCFFVIGPTAQIHCEIDGRGAIYDYMSDLQDIDRRYFSCTTLKQLQQSGAELKWVEAQYVMPDMYLLSLNRMAKVEQSYAVLPKHEGILWNNASTTVFELPRCGNFRRILVDFGDIYVGNLEFTIHASEGTMFDIYCFENMYRGEIDFTIGLNNGVRYICRKGWQHYRCMSRMGLRYVLLTVSGNTEPVELRDFFINYATFSSSNTGSFDCNDYQLNYIWKMCRHTHELCLEDSFTDCPTYEQAFWTGDAQTSAAVNTYVFGDYAFIRHNLILAQSASNNTPLFNALTPTDWGTSIPMWTMHWFISFVQYLENSGDKSVIPELYDKAKEMLLYFAGLMTEDGGFLVSAWNLVDWAPMDIPAYSVPTVYQALLTYCFEQFAKIAHQIGKTNDAKQFAKFYDKASSYLNEQLWCEERQAFYDSWCPESGFSKTFSIQTHVLMILYEVITDQNRKGIVEKYLMEVPSDFVDVGSPFMLYYLYEAWAKIGKCDEIFDDIRQRWGEMFRYETTTCWEVFPGFYENSRTRSYCHSWSTSPAALMQKYLLGIRRDSDGFADVSIVFPDTKLRWCRGSIPTPYGPILVDWNKDISEYRLRIPEEIRLHGTALADFHVSIEYTKK